MATLLRARASDVSTRLLAALPSRSGLLLRSVQLRAGSSTAGARSADQLVLLYENRQGKPGYFKLISLVSGVQMMFWGYLSYFAFTELKEDQPVQKHSGFDSQRSLDFGSGVATEPNKTSRFFSFNFTSLKWRLGLSLLALGAGLMFTVTACMYPLRMVTRLYFIKPATAVQIHTYTPLGTMRALEAPLADLTSNGDRSASGSHISLKITNYPMFFLVDKQNGSFLSPRLFDTLIGARKKV